MMSSSFQRLLFVVPAVAVAALLVVKPCVAQPVDGSAPIEVDEANRLFREGREDFNAGRTKDAHRKYRTAWKLRKSPDVAANMAQAELELGQYDQAAMHFAYALAYLLPSTSREQRVALEQALADVRTKVGRIELRLRPVGAAVTIDGKSVDPVLLETGLFVEPGGHVLGATADGYSAVERTVAVAAGESMRFTLALEAETTGEEISLSKTSPPPNGTIEEGSRSRPGRTSAVLVGGALASAGYVVGAVYLARMARVDRDADSLLEAAIDEVGEDACPEEAATGVCGELRDTLLQRDRSRDVAIGGFIAGGALTAATVVAAVVWPKRKGTGERAVSVQFAGGPRDAALTIGARF